MSRKPDDVEISSSTVGDFQEATSTTAVTQTTHTSEPHTAESDTAYSTPETATSLHTTPLRLREPLPLEFIQYLKHTTPARTQPPKPQHEASHKGAQTQPPADSQSPCPSGLQYDPILIDDSDTGTQLIFNSSSNEKATIPAQLVVTKSEDLSNAFKLMIDTLLKTPNLNDKQVAGVILTEKDIESLPAPKWYTDAIVDAVAHFAIQSSPRPDTVYYQDSVSITAHIPLVRDNDIKNQEHNRKCLEHWCYAIHRSEITCPGRWWPCQRMRTGCRSISFVWNPFGYH